VRSFVLRPLTVSSTSMEPTLCPGDRVLVDLWDPDIDDLSRGDTTDIVYLRGLDAPPVDDVRVGDLEGIQRRACGDLLTLVRTLTRSPRPARIHIVTSGAQRVGADDDGPSVTQAPLWGLGQRVFFLHDGRTNSLLAAITAHASNANGTYQASEANTVISRFNALSTTQKQNMLNFLRSL